MRGKKDMKKVVKFLKPSTRRRRETWITPCKRSAARGRENRPILQPRSGLNSYGVPECRVVPLSPELRLPACKGLSGFQSYGLHDSRYIGRDTF